MKKTELIKVLTFISNAYPNKFSFPRKNKNDNKIFIETWYSFLKDYNYNLVKIGVKKIIINKATWPPTVGELVKEIEKLKMNESDKLTGAEAWAIALEAVRKYGFYDMAQAMKDMPSLVKKSVECFGGYDALCHSKVQDSYSRQNFIRIYEDLARKNNNSKFLPSSIYNEVQALRESKDKEDYNLLKENN